MEKQDYHHWKDQLGQFGQQQLLRFWDELDDKQQKGLLNQISQLEWSRIPDWIENHVLNDAPPEIPESFDPAPSYDPDDSDPAVKKKLQEARNLGEQLIRSGKVATFVVAGGQGTRLGFDGPKGSYPISPIQNKTLFQLFAETIRAAAAKYDTRIPFYVMTSELNHAATVEVFEANDNYGLKDIMFFRQGTLPSFDFEGKILLAEKGRIATNPDGHGGSLKALYNSGAIADMRKRGVEYISYFQVDNPLIHIVDPLFIGLHAMDKADMSSKALVKAYPKEKVGNFCLVDGKVTVIEYSDLPDEYAEKRNDDGSLVFELGSIAIHMISVDFVEQLNKEGFALPLHRAVKKIPHVAAAGNKVEPDQPNGVKLETFVFDALPLADRSIILQTRREEEFAPVKNASGVDSAEVTRKMMTERAAAWLEQAGTPIPRTSDGDCDCTIEMAPSFAIEHSDVKPKLDRVPEIKPGDKVYLE